jgi:hypothetical protein
MKDIEKARRARAAKKEARVKLAQDEPELYELLIIFQRHFRAVRKLARSTQKIEHFLQDKFGIDP